MTCNNKKGVKKYIDTLEEKLYDTRKVVAGENV